MNQSICKITPLGTKIWTLNGECHREDGPAIEDINGNKSWYLHGKIHREDGPALEYVDGVYFWLRKEFQRVDGYKEWWFKGINFTEKYGVSSQEEFERYFKLKAFW
jgi:hypothetical protein